LEYSLNKVELEILTSGTLDERKRTFVRE